MPSLCLSVVFSCSNTEKETRDKLDSSLNLISVPKNVLQVYTLDVPWTCEQATAKVKIGNLHKSMLDALLLMQIAQCLNLKKNKINPDSFCVTVITHSDVVENDSMNIIGYVPVYFSNTTNDRAVRKIIELAKLPKQQDPSTFLVESAIGTYSIAQYLHKIKFTTPVIVLMPRSLPSKKLTPAVYKAAFKISG